MEECLVSVIMITYNHEAYIREAIDGVLMQKTSFRYELIIHDDCSIDNTTNIVREYEEKHPDLIKAFYEKENQISKGKPVLIPLIESSASGKYIAICEGDDFWIDDRKLQKQVDFMEGHEDYSFCFHNAYRLDVRSNEKSLLNTLEKSCTVTLEEQVKLGLGSKFPATASYFFKKCQLNKEDFLRRAAAGDYFIRVFFASKGKSYYFSEPMSVYRYMSGGSFMYRIANDVDAYLKYVTTMIPKYESINRFLNYQFDDIYSKKILSDYIGLATVMVENDKELNSCEINMQLLKNIVYKLNNIVDDKLITFCGEETDVWIYGTSKLAFLIGKKLSAMSVGFKGFVVTDGYHKDDCFAGRQVVYYSNIRNVNELRIVLGVQPINEKDITSRLNEDKIKYFSLFEGLMI